MIAQYSMAKRSTVNFARHFSKIQNVTVFDRSRR